MLTRSILVVITALLVPLLAVAPAEAQQRVRHDAIGDDNGGGDIKKLVVRHQRWRVVIKVVLASRADRGPEEMWLRVDRPNTERRWDYVIGTGMYRPRWYSVWRRGSGDKPRCSLKRRGNFDNVIRLVVPRRCFKWPQRLKVRVSSYDLDLQDDLMGNPNSEDRTRWTRYARRG